jgi:dTDP-4-dehydrorhamnose reductase
MVGRAVVDHCREIGDEVFAFDHRRLDIADHDRVQDAFEKNRPEVVINCAAWTDVDGCELDQQRAFDVNARGPELLAQNCRRIGASLISISTDYVFDGRKEGFYDQRDDPNPISIYGAAKLDGERRSQAACARTMIVRTGFIFGVGGRNFLSTVIERGRRGESLSAIADSYGTPTYAVDLARRLRELAKLDLPGVYHVVNQGEGVSYRQFAEAALAAAGCDSAGVASITTAKLSRPAPRPVNSRLRCLLSPAVGLGPLPPWQDALKKFAAASI